MTLHFVPTFNGTTGLLPVPARRCSFTPSWAARKVGSPVLKTNTGRGEGRGHVVRRANLSWRAVSWFPPFRRGRRDDQEKGNESEHPAESPADLPDGERLQVPQESVGPVAPVSKVRDVISSAVSAFGRVSDVAEQAGGETESNRSRADQMRDDSSGTPTDGVLGSAGSESAHTESRFSGHGSSGSHSLSRTLPGKVLVWLCVVSIGFVMVMLSVLKYTLAAISLAMSMLSRSAPALKSIPRGIAAVLTKLQGWALALLFAIVALVKNTTSLARSAVSQAGRGLASVAKASPSAVRGQGREKAYTENGMASFSVSEVPVEGVGTREEQVKRVRAADVMLAIMRHAKCEEESATSQVRDFDRTLSENGRTDATSTGEQLRDLGWIPDAVLCSGAARTRQTMDLLLQVFDDPTSDAGLKKIPSLVDDDMYFAMDEKEIRGIFDREHVAAQLASGSRVVLVGHNPGIERLVEALTGVKVHLRQASAALLHLQPDFSELDAQGWPNFLGLKWKLVRVIEPGRHKTP
ncbi:hypothetical protein FVE85_1720 [Porphyridium purpureum]|uniref:Phosphohistidine phosphatase SixA n=1 Tax=Porphyridium purpureum TaxID=35688 RepID=A0A5J4YWM5_PORPP|nr:hypothetical protein FVE85_1720 [Porphyridium purpureum]|eukprot:POR5306..scf209_3